MNMCDEVSSADERKTVVWAKRHRTQLALAGIVLLGLTLRVVHLDDKSVWYDEWASVSTLGEPDFSSAFELQRNPDPNATPVYYFLQYYWKKVAGNSLFVLRLLPVAIGILAIPLLYVLGRDLFGAPAGLVAALFLALSHIHIHTSQELRNYGLMVLLALLSMYTLLKVVRDGRPGWWVLHFVANLLLLWTHLFGLFVLVAQGVFLLAFRWRELRRLMFWGVVNATIVFPVYLFVLGMQHWDYPSAQRPIRLWQLVGCFDGDFYFSIFHLPTDAVFDTIASDPNVNWAYLPPWFARALAARVEWIELALALGLFATVLWLGFHVLQVAVRKRPSGALTGAEGSAVGNGALRCGESFGFAALWAFGPALASYAVAWAWRPDACLHKYTTHSALAVYLIFGGAIMSITRRKWRRAVAGALLSVQVSLLVVGLSYPKIPDYMGARNHIEAHADSNDVIVFVDKFRRDMFSTNLEDAQLRLLRAPFPEDVPVAVEAELDRGRDVWLGLCCDEVTLSSIEFLDEYWPLRGVTYKKSGFLGTFDILIYELTRSPAYVPLSAPGALETVKGLAKRHADNPFFFLRVARELAPAESLEPGDWPYPPTPDWLSIRRGASDDLIAAGHLDEGFEGYAYVLGQTEPDARASVHLQLIEALVTAGHAAEAEAECRKYIETYPRTVRMQELFGLTLLELGRFEEAIGQFREMARLAPGASMSHIRLASALHTAGRDEEARQAYLSAAATTPVDVEERIRLGESLEVGGCLEEAVKAYEQAVALDRRGCLGCIKLDELWSDSNSPEERVALWREMAVRFPSVPRVFFQLGLALEVAQGLGPALDAFRRASELAPGDPFMLSSYGVALVRSGDFEGALVPLRAALELYADSEQARQGLVRAYYETKQYDAAWGEVAYCREHGVPLDPGLLESLARSSGRGP